MFKFFKRKTKEKQMGKSMFEESEEMASFVQKAYTEKDPIQRNARWSVINQMCDDQW